MTPAFGRQAPRPANWTARSIGCPAFIGRDAGRGTRRSAIPRRTRLGLGRRSPRPWSRSPIWRRCSTARASVKISGTAVSNSGTSACEATPAWGVSIPRLRNVERLRQGRPARDHHRAHHPAEAGARRAAAAPRRSIPIASTTCWTLDVVGSRAQPRLGAFDDAAVPIVAATRVMPPSFISSRACDASSRRSAIPTHRRTSKWSPTPPWRSSRPSGAVRTRRPAFTQVASGPRP